MANLFASLPTEVVELIVEYLGLSDIRALRFASRDISAKLTGSSRFITFCSTKQVELRVSSLQKLAARLSRAGSVESHLEHLTVTGVLCVTKGLERIIRDKTKPTNLQDPCGARRDDIGNILRAQRVPATQSDLDDACAQLSHFHWRNQEAKSERDSRADLNALVSLFDLIRKNCKKKGLSSLSLNVAVYREKTTVLPPAIGAPWRQVFETAKHVFSTAMRASERSRLGIEHLDVFSRIEACSVQAYDIAKLQDEVDFANAPGLRCLSLSVSNRVLSHSPDGAQEVQDADPDDERRTGLYDIRPNLLDQSARQIYREEQSRLVNDARNISAVSSWLQRLPHLEELRLRNYLVINGYTVDLKSATRGKTIMKHIADNAPLPKLKKLTICGTNLEFDSLMKILQNSPDLESLSLQEVILFTSPNTQSWEAVFAHITSPTSRFRSVYLDNLFDNSPVHSRYIACFSPSTRPGDSISSGEDACSRKRRLQLGNFDFRRPSAKGHNSLELNKREDVLRGIAFEPISQYIVGSVQNSMWMEHRQRNYGPAGRS